MGTATSGHADQSPTEGRKAAPSPLVEITARLREQFPAWNIIRTDRGRWFATRGPLVREDLDGRATVDADTAEQLAERIRAVCRGR